MDLHHLRVFRSAAVHKSFTRASEELHISQSTVSQHIKQMEDELGCPLFLRVGRRVVPNAAGNVLLEYSEKILRDLKNAEMAARETGGLRRGIIRLGTGASTLIYRLTQVLSRCRELFPEIELIVVTGTTEFLLKEVKAQRLDLAIVMAPPPEPGLQITSLGREELVIAVPPRHAMSRKSRISRADLAELTFILFERHSVMQNLIDRYFSDLGVRPRVSMEMENIEAVKSLVRASVAASVLPACALTRPESGDICALRIKNHPLFRDLALVSLGSGLLPAAIRELSNMIQKGLAAGLIDKTNVNPRQVLLDK